MLDGGVGGEVGGEEGEGGPTEHIEDDRGEAAAGHTLCWLLVEGRDERGARVDLLRVRGRVRDRVRVRGDEGGARVDLDDAAPLTMYHVSLAYYLLLTIDYLLLVDLDDAAAATLLLRRQLVVYGDVALVRVRCKSRGQG